MKKSLKFLTSILAVVSCFVSVGCVENSFSSKENNQLVSDAENVLENEILLSGMNTYNELTNMGINGIGTISLNFDKSYVKGGDASAKCYFKDNFGRVENIFRIGPNIEKFKAVDTEEISCWIYNANDYDVDYLFAGYDTASRVIFSKKIVLEANEWTNFSMSIDRYQMQLINPTISFFRFVYDTHGANEATFYMDSFKVKTSESQPKVQTKEGFENGEILHFNSFADIVWATPVRRNTYGEIITVPTYEYSIDAPFSENGGALKLGVNRLTQLRSSTVIWNGSYNLTELTGFKVPTQLLNTIDLEGVTKLSLDIFHDYTQERQMTLVITDEVGTSAKVTSWVAPNEWTTLSIEDFGQLDFKKIVAIEFFYAEYMTFSDYNIYIDNLSYTKEA